MKNISVSYKNYSPCESRLVRLFAAIGIAAAFLLSSSARGQTATLLATNQNIFVGANFSGIYTNNQLRSVLSGTAGATVTLSVAGAPAGTTILFSTNNFVNAANPLDTTNSWNPIGYSVAVTNVAAGIYPLTFTLSGGASATATVNLIVGNRWTNSNPAGNVSWAAGANWSTGVAPGAGDDVIFQDAGNTNYVDSSYTINSLTFLPAANTTNQNMLIAPGATLAVKGTNSFFVNSDSTSTGAKTFNLNIYGPGAALVVSNRQGNFSANSSQGTGGATSGLTLYMTNLDNFAAYVSRFGLGDWTMAKAGGVAANEMASGSGAQGASFAKTNVISAFYPGDYALTNFNPTFAISLLKEGDPFNNGSAQTINLGLSNSISADSLALAQNKAGGNPNYLRFYPGFTNNVIGSMPYVSFRNTNGGRMNLVGVGIDSGTAATGSNTRGRMDFVGGVVDMMVDTIWLGRDRTATVNTNTGSTCLGIFNFSYGTVDVNTLIAGYQAYTNNCVAQGQINVGGGTATNGVLNVNNNLILGFYSGDFGTGSTAAGGFGQLTILTNGIVRASQITVGNVPGFQSQNRITISAGGTLDVTNAIGDANNTLPSLINNGGTNVLHLNGTSTLIYCSNVTALAGSKISIASVVNAVLNTPIPVIVFTNGTTPNNFGWSGIAPFGLNVVIGTTPNSVTVTLSTGNPKSVRWMGFANNVWDTTTPNWLDTATGLHTNFATGDQVSFDDTASQFNIDVQGDILPSQAGVGIAMTNTTPYTFTTTGFGRLLGGVSLVKQGTGSLTVDIYTEMAATLSQGAITNTAVGTIGTIAADVNTALISAGTVLGNVSSGGIAVNSGTINGGLTAKTSSFVTNDIAGTVKNGLGMETNSFLYNAGTFTGIGTATVVSNATFINAGTIANGGFNAGSLAVSGTFEDMGVGAGTVLNLSALVINGGGTFIPGGDGIGTTKITSDGNGLDGRVQFLTGSTNIFKVDLNASPANTMVTCGFIAWGPSQSTLIQNGGFLFITNVGVPPLAPGQSFQLVGNNFGGPPFDSGLNTTNSLSNIIPSVPAPGEFWDLSQLIHGGLVAIKTIPTTGTNMNFSITTGITISTNVPPVTNNVVITELSWPQEYVGWKLQTLSSPTNGVESTNWQDIATAQFTNDIILTNALTPGNVFYRMKAP